jgi:hypothetical protein
VKGYLAYAPGDPGIWVSVDWGTDAGSSVSFNDFQWFTRLDQGPLYTAVKFFDSRTGWAGGINLEAGIGGVYKWNPDIPVGLKEPRAVNQGNLTILVYPNPSQGTINIKEASLPAGKYQVSLVDLQGKIVYREYLHLQGDSPVQVDLPVTLRNGIYVLALQNGDLIRRAKLSLAR